MKIVAVNGVSTEITRRRNGVYATFNPRFGDVGLFDPATGKPVVGIATGVEVVLVSGNGTSPLTFKVVD